MFFSPRARGRFKEIIRRLGSLSLFCSIIGAFVVIFSKLEVGKEERETERE